MNPEQLLAHFDRLADVPDAIPRLRRFILDIAVRGKLVEQDANDEPASELLKRIHAEKLRLVEEGKLKKQDSPAGQAENKLAFDLPVGWCFAPLQGVCISITDGDHLPPPKTEEGIPFLVIGNVRWNSIDFTGCRYVSPEYYQSLEDIRRPQRGDILYTLVGSFGIPVIVHDDRSFCIQRHIGILRPSRTVSLSYIARALESRFVFDQAEACATGIAQKTVPLSGLRRLLIPLPPLAEQHRIVAKVDELMALCDRLEAAQTERESRRDRLASASLHRLNNGADADNFREHVRFHLRHLPRLTTRPKHIQQLRQTILDLAVRGQLVPQDLNDEPASDLFKRIQAEKARLVKEGKIKRLPPPLPIEAAEIPAAVPDGWKWVRVSDLLLGDSQNGYSKKPDDALDGIPILRISAGTVRKDGIVAEEEHKLIGGVSAAQQEQYELQPGDLLACRFNGNRSFVGRLSLYLGYLGIKPIYPDKLIRLRLLSQFALPKLVRCFAESSVIRRDIETYCATTVGNWGISASNLKDVKIPLPPLPEQQRIVTKVDELMALCDRLEAQLTIARTESHRLLKVVLHEALAPVPGVRE